MLRGLKRSKFQYGVGQVLNGFKVVDRKFIPEYSVEAISLCHQKTGAQYLHIDSEDTNNVFSVNFKTPSMDSVGTAHILEHTVLCGSERYPVRDPFFNMMKRSLNTFMNAMTASDHTMYPFSTTNAVDFENLQKVYLDAAFFPLLREEDCLQEGCRLDFVEKENKEKLVYKGVVLNEMKGVLADTGNLFATRLQQLLLPGTSYQHVSGGDPADIIRITVEDLRKFHKLHYHPSNCMFYSYGDLPLENTLARIDATVLDKFQFCKQSAKIRADELNPSDFKTVKVELPCAPEMSEQKNTTRYCESVHVGNACDAYESLLMRMVSFLLLNGPSSPMYQALIDSGLGSDFCPGSGYDGSTKTATFGVGVQGAKASDVSKIEQTIQDTLQSVVKNGFDKDRVEGLFNQIELSQKHMVGNFGISILYGIANLWAHGGDPRESLMLNDLLQRLRKEIGINENFWGELVESRLLKNQSKATLIMSPSDDFLRLQEEKESNVLQELQQSLNKEDVKKIKLKVKQLNASQEQKENVECLPSLSVSDIPKKVPITDTVQKFDIKNGQSNIAVECVEANSNDICYFRAAFDTNQVPQDLKLYLPLFSAAVSQLGAGKLDHQQLSNQIESNTGGISFSPHCLTNFSKHGQVDQIMLLETMCLGPKVDKTFQLTSDVLLSPNFNNIEQLRIIIDMLASNCINSVASNGTNLARSYAAASLSDASYLREQYNGIAQLQFLQQLSEKIQGDQGKDVLVQVAEELSKVAKILFNAQNMKASFVVEPHLRDSFSHSVENFVQNLPEVPSSALDLESIVNPLVVENSFFKVPLATNFVVQCSTTVPLEHEDHASLTILAQLLQSVFLHKDVREKGGAYGSGANQGNGIFSFSSYYDPNTIKTLEAFDRSVQEAAIGKFNLQDIDEAKMSVFGGVDAPTPPSRKGRGEFLQGITTELRQKNRDRLLSVNREDILRVADQYLISTKSSISRVIAGTEEQSKQFLDLGWNVKNIYKK